MWRHCVTSLTGQWTAVCELTSSVTSANFRSVALPVKSCDPRSTSRTHVASIIMSLTKADDHCPHPARHQRLPGDHAETTGWRHTCRENIKLPQRASVCLTYARYRYIEKKNISENSLYAYAIHPTFPPFSLPLSSPPIVPTLPLPKEVNKKLSYRRQNVLRIIKTHERNTVSEHVLSYYLYAYTTLGITFSTCPSIRLFCRYQLVNATC